MNYLNRPLRLLLLINIVDVSLKTGHGKLGEIQVQ